MTITPGAKATTNYAAWSKFDVEKELEEIDTKEQEEQQQKATIAARNKFLQVENEISQDAQQDAEVLAAHAAVAALKASQRNRTRRHVTGGTQNNVKTVEKLVSHVNLSECQSEPSQTLAQSHFSNVTATADATTLDPSPVDANKQKEEERRDDQEGQDEDEDMRRARLLKQQAELYQRKHALVRTIVANRREGEQICQTSLANENLCSIVREPEQQQQQVLHALRFFRNCIEATKQLEAIVPELNTCDQSLLITKRRRQKESCSHASSSSPSWPEPSKCAQDCHSKQEHPEAGHTGATDCCHRESQAQGQEETTKMNQNLAQNKALPNKNDLKGIVKMFFCDGYVGLGKCLLHQQRLAHAADAFKEVLLRDDRHRSAWLLRGKTFEQMGVPLLALLHYTRLTHLNNADEEAQEELARIKRVVLGKESTAGTASLEQEAAKYMDAATDQALMASAIELFQQASVVMAEAFYSTSNEKYELVLRLLQSLSERLGSSNACATQGLNQLRVSCHLNIASGYHEMHKQAAVGIHHCDLALQLDPQNPIAVVRKAQLLRLAHDYEKALMCLEQAQQIVQHRLGLPGTEAPGRSISIKTVDRIRQEQDKCGFERSQYDLQYIKSLS